MAKVIKIAVSQNFGGRMKSVEQVEVIKGEGVIGDRHFKKANKNTNQITFIESENIDNFYIVPIINSGPLLHTTKSSNESFFNLNKSILYCAYA